MAYGRGECPRFYNMCATIYRGQRGKPLGFPLKISTFCFVSSKQKVRTPITPRKLQPPSLPPRTGAGGKRIVGRDAFAQDDAGAVDERRDRRHVHVVHYRQPRARIGRAGDDVAQKIAAVAAFDRAVFPFRKDLPAALLCEFGNLHFFSSMRTHSIFPPFITTSSAWQRQVGAPHAPQSMPGSCLRISSTRNSFCMAAKRSGSS